MFVSVQAGRTIAPGIPPPQDQHVHAPSRYRRAAALACIGLVLCACKAEESTGPDQSGARIVLGATASDTIEALLSQAVVVEVRGTDGQPMSGAVVRFESQRPTDAIRQAETAVSVCALNDVFCTGFAATRVDTTGADGRAKALVRLGTVAGTAKVRVSVPSLGVTDSATFTVLPGAIVAVRASVADTTLEIGTTAIVTGRAVDRRNNTRPDVPTLSALATDAFAVNATSSTVTGNDMGTGRLYVRFGAYADSTTVRVIPSGRIVVWSTPFGNVTMVNLNGSSPRNVITGVGSSLGVFPRFDPTRQRITLHTSSNGPALPNTAIVVDTLGGGRRDIGPGAGFLTIESVRQFNDGTVMAVGRRATEGADYWLYRIATDNTVTIVNGVPGLVTSGEGYGGADISPDGTKLAYLNSIELRIMNVATAAFTVIEPNARSPRWSPQGDRVAYLVPAPFPQSTTDGVPVVANADGSGRRRLGSTIFSPGLAWSPDGKYLLGHAAFFGVVVEGLHLIRVSDASELSLIFRGSDGRVIDYFQPDWR